MTLGSTQRAAGGVVWLVDATTYAVELPGELAEIKERYFRLQTCSRIAEFGPHEPRGAESFSAGLLRIAEILERSGCEVRYMPLEALAAALDDAEPADAPDAIGFGAVCPTVPACAALAAV